MATLDPLWTNRQTQLKTLPSSNFTGGGNKRMEIVQRQSKRQQSKLPKKDMSLSSLGLFNFKRYHYLMSCQATDTNCGWLIESKTLIPVHDYLQVRQVKGQFSAQVNFVPVRHTPGRVFYNFQAVPVVDPKGEPGTRAPSLSKFFQIHAVFGTHFAK